MPSMWSSRLNAFVIPTSQTTASGTATQSFLTSSTVRPFVSTIAAAPPCAASFATAGNPNASSSSPTANSRAAAPMIASSVLLPLTAPTAIASPTPARIPAKTPIPPRAGVSRVCQRSLDGFAARRAASGVRNTVQITAPHTGNAIAETSALIARVLHLESVGDVGVRRASPPSRALCEPVSPRLSRQVQRHVSRRSVVAGQSARPHGDLHAGVLGAVPRFQDPPLPAVSPLGARHLGVPVGVAANVRALATRQREPDQEGALPAPAHGAVDRR